MLSYKPLWKLLIDRGMNRTELRRRAGLTTDTLAKMGKGLPVHGRNIDAICRALGCRVEDVIEYLPGEGPKDEGGED